MPHIPATTTGNIKSDLATGFTVSVPLKFKAKDSYTSNEEGKKISDYGWIHWGELLENEKNLIKKVLSADSKRISA